jgi:hypothetical protein
VTGRGFLTEFFRHVSKRMRAEKALADAVLIRLQERGACYLRRHLFQLIAERSVVAALEAAFLALAFAGLYQMTQTPGTLSCGLPAFGATVIPLHAQLVLSLPRNRQVCELIFYPFSHLYLFLFPFCPVYGLGSIKPSEPD